jgi:phage FluMu protein Com
MNNEWRCHSCGKLLGTVRRERLQIRFSRGHEYTVAFPVTGVCRSCHALNELASPPESLDQAQVLSEHIR